MASRYLDPAPGVDSRVLDESDEGCHEPPCPNRDARSGDLADLDHSPADDHLEPTLRPDRRDRERLNTLAGVDDGLDAIALHLGRAAVARPSSRATGRQKLYQTLSKGLLDLSYHDAIAITCWMQPVTEPYPADEDVWLRYNEINDIRRWGERLSSISSCYRHTVSRAPKKFDYLGRNPRVFEP